MPKSCIFLLTVFVALSFVVLTLGCKESGPPNYQLSGTITYKGEPVPKGEVFLRPIGNGPGGFAIIHDGKYETVAGKGSQGGMSHITFHGFGKVTTNNGTEGGGRDLFPPYKVEVDLPEEDFVFNVELPPKQKR